MKSKIIALAILLTAVLFTASCSVNPSKEGTTAGNKNAVLSQTAVGSYNYGEALQKAILFYEFQRSGKLPANQRNNWRGDSGLTDGSDVGLDLTGGWYDAGDHVKFGLPMAYTVSMLAWSVFENKDAYTRSGQLAYILDNIKWTTDYFIKCHSAPNEFYYQIGAGGPDHSWWGPAEVMQMARPSYKVTLAAPGSAVVGQTAAALAASSIVFKESNPAYAATMLQHAKELFTFADITKSDAGYTAANGFYNSWSGFNDELSFAAAWIYLATQDAAYLAKAEEYAAKWGTEPQSTTVAYKWGQSWDDVHYGAALMLARITGKDYYKTAIENNLDFWTTGVNGTRITYTPKGLAFLTQWGSLRHATTTAFLADVYADWSGCPAAKIPTYKNFAKAQLDYALGSTGRSYEIGFGVNPPQRPHHRTAHSSWADSQTVPNFHRHTLVGALVGGPQDANDGYVDDIGNYICNEVACDYNAGFVAVLARMYDIYGGDPIPNYKAIEVPSNDEFFVEAGVNASGPNFVEIKGLLNNRSGWPAKMGDKLSFKYFIDVSEFIANGYTANDITVSLNYNGGGVVSPKPIAWDASKNIYYVNVDFTGTKIYPGGQSAYKKEIQFRISGPMNTTFWNNANDYSYAGITTTPGGTPVQTAKIPVYDNGVKVYGVLPGDQNNSSVSSAIVSSSSSRSSVASVSSTAISSSRSSVTSVSSIASSSSRSSIASSSSISSAVSSSGTSSSAGQYVNKTAPFVYDGAGEYYWSMTSIPNFINCWNLTVLEINGVSFLNKWASTSQLPAKQNGYYYIHYKGAYPWSHFEAK